VALKNLTIKELSVNHDPLMHVLRQLPSQQAIAVIGKKDHEADLYLYEFANQSWILAGHMPANIAQNGMGKNEEGDQKSPVGIFTLGSAFGSCPAPEGMNYPYRMVTMEDYWVDDSRSKSYNRWVRYKEGYWKDWNSAECLGRETTAYKYGVIINYNSARQPGKGSAIFLHVQSGENSPTQGCTAVSEEDMVRILQWLYFDKQPVIIQGSWADIMSMSKEQYHILPKLPEGFVYVDDIIPDIFIDIRDNTEGSLPNIAIVTKQAAYALVEVQKKLSGLDFSIKILDAYRPQKSTSASSSPHHRGSALDVALMDLKTGQKADMGEENRRILQKAMEFGGFQAEDGEWWHFTLMDEPYPEQYFNFPVKR
jgi:L,D-peptidoglycan transpeptidase YkuD (ErfK/YbiS/YcfS/YnhG family)/D-alanyl-D-alanine dipeptidase